MKHYRNIFFLAVFYAVTIGAVYLAVTRTYEPMDTFAVIRWVMVVLFAPIIFKYVIHLLIAPWYTTVEFLRFKKNKRSRYTPTVSVLIPAWNEEVGIAATLRSVLATRYPNLEVVIVDDGSTDRTGEVVQKVIDTYKSKKNKNPAAVVYQYISNGGKARALNHALALSSGAIVITIDADSVMEKSFIRKMIVRFTDPKVASVAGNVVIGNRFTPLGVMQQLEYLYGFYFKRADAIMHAVYIVGGAAAAYRRDVLARVGGFDEQIITEDIELSTRLQDCGYRVSYAADAVVYTEGPSDFAGLMKQRLRWKFGRLLTFFKYRHLFFSTRKGHNVYLTFLILPIALFAEILLFFEGVLLTIFYTYTFYTGDFIPLVVFIGFLASVIFMQILTDAKTRYHANLFFVAPVAWLIFYVMDFVEYQALLRSIWRLIKRKELGWQRWNRVGVFSGIRK